MELYSPSLVPLVLFIALVCWVVTLEYLKGFLGAILARPKKWAPLTLRHDDTDYALCLRALTDLIEGLPQELERAKARNQKWLHVLDIVSSNPDQFENESPLKSNIVAHAIWDYCRLTGLRATAGKYPHGDGQVWRMHIWLI